MKTNLRVLSVSFFLACFFFCTVNESFAQLKTKPTLTFRKVDGRVSIVNTVGVKELNFMASGLTTQEFADDFSLQLKAQANIGSVAIGDLMINGDRSCKVTLVKGAKVSDFKQALWNLGITEVIVDGILESTKAKEEE